MPTWLEVSQEASELCNRVVRRMEKRRHKLLATLRRDGSPRISAIESVVISEGELWITGMPGTLKFQDLRRDPRFSLHSGTEDPPTTPEPYYVLDAKLSGVANRVGPNDVQPKLLRDAGIRSEHIFRADMDHISVLMYSATGDHLLLDTWTNGKGLERREIR